MIELKNLTKIYKTNRKSDIKAVNDVSLKLPDKGFVFIIGKSGSGKSTLLNMIGGLDSITSGSVIVNGTDIKDLSAVETTRYRNANIGFVFQDYHIIDHLTVRENVSLSLELANDTFYEKVEDVISKVELSEYINRYPKELSGGQKQRIAIARAIIKDVGILLCDEPTGNLDKKTTKQVLDILKEMSKERLVVIVSHNMLDAESYADRIIELAEGKVIRDRERMSDYDNSFNISNDVVMLPHYRDLEDEEVDEINKNIEEGKRLTFKQINNEFVPSNEDYKEECKKIKLDKSSVTRKTVKKLYKAFFNNRFTTIFSVFLAAVLLTCFAVFQSFLSFDGNSALSTSLLKNEISSLPLQKGKVDENSSTLSDILLVTDEDILEFRNAGYRDEIYSIYNISLPIMSSAVDSETSINHSNIFQQFYLKETLGVIECDDEFLVNLFDDNGEIKYLAHTKDYKDFGIYITDYIADSIIAYSVSDMTYDDVLGYRWYSNKKYNYIYVNGIIDTDYDVKYKEIADAIKESIENPDKTGDLFKKTKNSDLYKQFLSEASNSLGYGYTIEKNFYEAICSTEFRIFAKPSRYQVFKDDEPVFYIRAGNSITFYDSTEKHPELTGNSMVMSRNTYKNVFGVYYNNVDEFVPHTMKMVFYEGHGETGIVVYEKEIYISKLTTEGSNYINLEENKDLWHYDFIRYGIILENHNMIEEMINVASARGLTVASLDANQTVIVNKVIKTFNDMFVLIEVFFFAITVIFLVFIGISTVKQNKYEIGVLKAIGVGNYSIMRIFLKQSIILVVYIAIISNIGILFGTWVANKVMINAIMEILGVNVSDITVIRYIPSIVIQDLFNIGAIAVVSFIIPQILLFRIKPIEIIRAKE